MRASAAALAVILSVWTMVSGYTYDSAAQEGSRGLQRPPDAAGASGLPTAGHSPVVTLAPPEPALTLGPTAEPVPEPPKVNAGKLTRALNRYLARRPGRITATVTDLTTGRTFRYHKRERLPTASTVKVEILMALLLKTPWRKLGKPTRDLAAQMIRYSDNRAADTLWERIGHASGLRRASRRFGLRGTSAIDARCVDLYCWGIARTSADDQVRLMRQLATGKGPLGAQDREAVLSLMRRVIPEQRWGVRAGACEGDAVAVKNGWLHHVSNRRWVIDSIGLISGHGHEYAVAVLTEDNVTMGGGIAKVEGVTKIILSAFRGERGCQADGVTRR